MAVFGADAFAGHEAVHFFHDAASGLSAIIAVHSSALGTAGGGVRMRAYDTEDDALRDALRLSRAMTYKMAMAGLPSGGGKSVIIGDPRTDKSIALFRAFGRAVDSLGGRYICGEDVGTTPDDMDVIAGETAHCRGASGASGDTSPAAAFGVYQGLRAAVRHRFGRDDLAGITVAVQGVGQVGRHLCRHLADAGARLIVADIDSEAVARVVDAFGAEAVASQAIFDLEVDVFSPCALGAVLDDETIARLKASIVSGGANNQLAEDRHGTALHRRAILYAPDYVVNAGGAVNATREGPDYDRAEVMAAVEQIYGRTLAVFARAERDAIAPAEAADRMAEELIRAAVNVG